MEQAQVTEEQVYCALLEVTAPSEHHRIHFEYPGYIDIDCGPILLGFWADDNYDMHVKLKADLVEGNGPIAIIAMHISHQHSASMVALIIARHCQLQVC